jgi:hypothetical protein
MVDRKHPPDVERYNDDVADNFRTVKRTKVENDGVFESAALGEFFNWWTSQPNTPPAKSDFDVLEHPRLIPNLFLLRVIDPETFEFVLAGEQVIQLVGRNRAGLRIDTRDKDLPLRIFARYLRDVVASRQCWHCVGDLSVFERGHVRFESVDCPMTDPSGEFISHTIGVMVRH